ncbi:glycosyltransferase family 39 protein [Bradyrhizobium sp. 2TAF24]|uniref:glycosyltransferase family 39 protein n=1 Tax=Bradyrhizobium sp. 2TAF24 TaxID=3233011 RepID=UPI003F8E268B
MPAAPPLSDAFRTRAFAVQVFALALPAVLALLVFPTPLYDTRELMAWGRHLSWVTPLHPPMMVWIGGAVDWLFGPSSAAAILIGQILLAVGLVYLYAILALVTAPGNAALFTFLFGTSLYTTFAPLSFALNADILQLTPWPAIVFHYLRAARTDRRGHWLAFGFWSGIAVLTKYNAAVLFLGIGTATLAVAPFRAVLRRPGFYLASAVGLVMVAPHALGVLDHHSSVEWGLAHFERAGVAQTLSRLYEYLLGYLICFLPGAVIVVAGLLKRVLAWAPLAAPPARDDVRFLVVMNLTMQAILLGLVLIAGLDYLFRFDAPYAMMAVPALAPLVRWADRTARWFEREVTATIAGLYFAAAVIITVVYTFFASHSGLQEPIAAAAKAIRDDWTSRYRCGPAYIIGGRQGVYGVGIAMPRSVSVIDYHAITGAPWFDPAAVRAGGAVVIDDGPMTPGLLATFLPGLVTTEAKQVTLPLRRTHKAKTITYSYRFAAPQDCGS